jgi:general secretion pathway protein J
MKQRGFTLVELLVALFITAILFAMGYSALSQALNSRKEVDEQAKRLGDVQQALRTMEQDFELLQPRPVRDLLGTGYQGALYVNQNKTTGTSAPLSSATQQGLAMLSLTRGSWANPAGLPRSDMQRVSYLLRDDKLIRQYTPELDTTGAATIEERELLDKVEALSFRYMDDSLGWSDQWPTPILLRGPATDLPRLRPLAIEITLRLKDWGTLLRIVEVAA